MRDLAAANPPQLRADPLADAAIAAIFGPHNEQAGLAAHMPAIGVVNSIVAQWQSNSQMDTWRAPTETPAHIAAALEAFVREARVLPPWHDHDKIVEAEKIFMDMSMLSCTLLFCASLPECYLIPDLAAVLHAAGQLEQHTDYRVRSTAAMIFPVMMRGGLCAPEGTGVAQVLKVRLIHAMIRHLVLRGSPEAALQEQSRRDIKPLERPEAANLYQSLYAHGWNVDDDGLPCNQEELAYTLLTFHFIFLRGLRTLGLGLSKGEEEAYMHTWNVMGHVLGIEQGMMANTMADAARMFAGIKLRARGTEWAPDPRPALGRALIREMENEIPLRLLKPFPALLTRHLCGQQAAKVLGIADRVNPVSRALFTLGMGLIRGFDTVVRLFVPGFSISRMLTRAVGYRFTAQLLMDQTRPLKLPVALLNQVDAAMCGWQHDPKAPAWLNRLEAKLAGRMENKA